MANEGWKTAFWRDRRVLITGHTGFIGGWLSLWLCESGAQVTGYALPPPTQPALFDRLGLAGKLTHIEGDICDRKALDAALDASRPEIVLHLAAQAIVGQAFADPCETWRVNALGTVTLLDALRGRDSVQALAVYTTDKVYDNDESGKAYREDDPVGGFGLYDASKGATELAIRAFCHGGAAPEGTAVIRAGNVIGGGDWNAGRLVPDCIRHFQRGEPVELRHPHSIRPWQHVLDVCHGTLLLTQHLYDSPENFKGAWNIGPPAASVRSVAEVADILGEAFGCNPAWQQAEAAGFPEADILKLDSGKLERTLGWRPVLNIEESLRLCAQWYGAAKCEDNDMAAFTHTQIKDFQRKLRLQ